MPRPRSDDKRAAILAAAMKMFAERGLGASPTSAISKAAGVAEGTLFTYFKTKDDLVNALYREIKLDVAAAIMSSLPRTKDVRSRLHHLWDGYVSWGAANPDQRKVLAQLQVSDTITAESRASGYAPFAEIEAMARDAVAEQILRDYPVQLIAATLSALAEMIMVCMAQDPKKAAHYRAWGFEILWSGIAAK
ncbi:MAG: TetR/AcrR family transcriptional regulator [Byssovorax sp.]